MKWDSFIGEIALALVAAFALWVILLRPFAAKTATTTDVAPAVVGTEDQTIFGIVPQAIDLSATNYLTVNQPNGENKISAPGGQPEDRYLSSIDDYVKQMGPLADAWAENVLSFVNAG